jgi:predicted transcriptional regulator
MHPPPEPQPRQRHDSARCQARLDAETHAKLEALATALYRKRSAILRFVMQWGLHHSTRWTIDRSPVSAVPPVPVLLEPELHQRVQDAAAAHSATVAAWLRHALRHVTTDDFPASWRLGETARRSHESGYYDRKFRLRLDAVASHTLETLTRTFERLAAEVIRQIIRQTKLEDFPPSWQLAGDEPHQREIQPGEGD